MKAAVLFGPKDLRIVEKDKPAADKGHAVVKVRAVGICAGDIHYYLGDNPYAAYPRVVGHEIAGVVDAVPGNESGIAVGDRIVVEPLIPCGTCFPCRKGKYNCCVRLQVIGVHVDGGFAEYVRVPVERLHKIPDAVPFDVASVLEPYSIGAQCMSRVLPEAGDKVLIVGAGAIGLTILDWAKNAGCACMVSDIYPYRLDIAASLGADRVVDSRREDLDKAVLDFTEGEGAAIVFEATGVSAIMGKCEDWVAAGGKILIVGLTNDKVQFSGINITKKEMTICGSRNSANVFPKVVKACIEGRIRPEKILTKKFPFDAVREAMDFVVANTKSVGKVVVEY